MLAGYQNIGWYNYYMITTFEFIDHTNLDPETLAREKGESIVKALIRERDDYQKRIDNAGGDKDLTKTLTADIASVDDSLSSMAEFREPRNSLRK
jgi:hypothetical protein